MSKRVSVSIEIIREMLENFGYELVSDEYIDIKTKLIFKDKEGYYYSISYNTIYKNIKRNSIPNKFDKNNPFTFQNIKLFLILSGSIYRLHPMEYKYINNSQDLLVEDREGYLYITNWDSLYGNIKRDSELNKFHTSNPYSIKNLRLWLGLNNKPFELISNTYNGTSNYLKWKCLKEGCNEEFKATWGNISGISGSGCPKCASSKGEKKTREYLQIHNINFKEQFRFKDCKDKISLPFDFAILNKNNDLICLIEYDGEQHYKIQRYSSLEIMTKKLFVTQKHDKTKDNYCLFHNIPLLRIPYWEFNNIEEILSNYLEELSEKDGSFLD